MEHPSNDMSHGSYLIAKVVNSPVGDLQVMKLKFQVFDGSVVYSRGEGATT